MKKDLLKFHKSKELPGRECENLQPGFFLPQQNLPLPLITWAVPGNRCNILSTFMYVRSHDGIADLDIKEAAKQLDCTTKTINNRIKWLHNEGWLIKISKGRYIAISLAKLCLKLTQEQPGKVWFPSCDLSMLKRVLICTLIGWYNLLRDNMELWPGNPRPNSIHAGGLAASVIAKFTNTSKAWALKWEWILKKCGLLSICKNPVQWDITWGQLDTERSSPDGCVVVRKVRKTWNNKTYELAANLLTTTFENKPIFKKEKA